MPLCVDTGLLPLRLNDTSPGSPRKLLEDQRSEDELCEGDGLAGDRGLRVCGWAIDESLDYSQYWRSVYLSLFNISTYPLVVDDLNDSCQLAVGRSSMDEDDAADLHQSPRRSLDICVTHFD